MEKITKHLAFILFILSLSIGNPLRGQVDPQLSATWELEGENLIIRYCNHSIDTIYVADLSLSRGRGEFLPSSSSNDVNIAFYILSRSGKDEFSTDENSRIFLGATIIPPNENKTLIYRTSRLTIERLVVEYTTIHPRNSYHRFRKLTVIP